MLIDPIRKPDNWSYFPPAQLPRTNESMCATSAPPSPDDNFVYKRRMLPQNSFALLKDQNSNSNPNFCVSSTKEDRNFINSTSPRDLCISVLRSNGLLYKSDNNNNNNNNNNNSPKLEKTTMGEHTKPCLLKCKVCGVLEDSTRMLICDHCEEAIHVSCCNPRIQKLPEDDWYCQQCSRSFRPAVPPYFEGKISEERRIRSRAYVDSIRCMLSDMQPYTSAVRIGTDFQAEVPEWSGPDTEKSDPYFEPIELDMSEYSYSDYWKNYKPAKSQSIGNWVQCREILETGDNDEEIVCGKWRRAPLFVVQTDDWDCSCALPWDPLYADCAVPQEVETEVVFKHLKFIEMLRPRLENSKLKHVQRK